jgi:zeta-carotene desaturase
MHAEPGRTPDAIVVGGGFAGLAAATLLAERGARVQLLEMRPYLGGRARSWIDPETGSTVDNGQHLFMGCYGDTLLLLDRLGTRDRLNLEASLTVPFIDPGGAVSRFALPSLPLFSLSIAAGLLRFPGLSRRERLGLLRVALAARSLSGRRARQGTLDEVSVSSWLRSLGQSSRTLERLWHPLAIAALNEEPERASAAMLLPVLEGLFASGADGARLGVPRVGLSDLYADPAGHFLRARGSDVRLRAQVRQVLFDRGRCEGVLLADGTRHLAPHVIVSVPPADLLEMLPAEIAAQPFFAGCSRLETSPIVSVYLWFGGPLTDLPYAGLIGGEWQWLFNRRAFAGRGGAGAGVTLVRSAARSFVEASREVLVRKALDDLHRFFPASRRLALRHALVIKEKRAAISPSCGSSALRPASRTPFDGLHLAGDWTATGLPATIEGAVISGHACARQTEGSFRPPSTGGIAEGAR